MFWKKDEMDFILPFQKIIDGDIMTFRVFNKLNYLLLECNYNQEIAKENVRNGVINKTRYTRLLESHFSLDNVLKFLASNDLRYVKNIILCHLSDTNSNQMIMQNRVYEQTKIKTTIARPGLDLELKLYPF